MNLAYIIMGVVAALILLFIIMYFISRSKAKIEIRLPNYNFSPGDFVEGQVFLKIKKPVEVKSLNVGILGNVNSTSYNKDLSGKKRRDSRTSTIFDFEQPIHGQRQYPIGEYSYPFKIKIPTDVLTRITGSPVMNTLIKSAQILSGTSSRINWYAKASLDIKGMDVNKSVRINVG